MADNKSVRVAVRIRPLVPSETSRGCADILEVYPEAQQIRIKNSDRAFTFNHVFGPETTQNVVYESSVQKMMANLFQGYNLTILAYGQTGSGKTHSMGTTFDGEGDMGIIPRAVHEIFAFVRENFSYDYSLSVSFMELYQEILYDLLSDKNRQQSSLELREDSNKEIVIPGLTEIQVKTSDEVLAFLMKGSNGRVTGSTNMNAQSSRSHAIFTVNLCMKHKTDSNENKVAKLHLVDLAGSERQKKTGAVGTTFKEGVNINKGLLVLGNVISALGDGKNHSYIPYRDSILTRLLKDSLGGNSVTLMVACVSPADYNMEETLSTLRYADRARQIQNKPIVNQDPKAVQINELKKTVDRLKLQLLERGPGDFAVPLAEVEEHKLKIRDLTAKISEMLSDKTSLLERAMILQSHNDGLYTKIASIKDEYSITLKELLEGVNSENWIQVQMVLPKLQMIDEKLTEIDADRQKSEAEIIDHDHNSMRFDKATIPDEKHAQIQMDLNNELTEVSKQIAIKERLARQIQLNNLELAENEAIAKNEEKLTQLEREKDELLKSSKSANTTKVAAQKRKKIEELEKQICDLKRQQARLLAMKEKDEVRMKSLGGEILDLKQIKVRLIRSMREAEVTHRLKIQKGERDLIRVKQEDRKKASKIAKMELMHSKQKNVLKRKVEEAVALNKKLKETLATREKIQNMKHANNSDKIGNWLKHELDVFLQLAEAEESLKGLLKDRAMLTEELEKLRNSSDVDSTFISAIEEDIEIRSIQIADLQQKILLSDAGSKSKTRLNNIQTISDAKFALKLCLDQLADLKKAQVRTGSELLETQATLTEVTEQKNELQSALELVDYKYSADFDKIKADNEERVCLLLKQLKDVPPRDGDDGDSATRERFQVMQEKLDSQDTERHDLMSQIYNCQQEVQELKNKLNTINEIGNKAFKPLQQLQPPPELNVTYCTPPNNRRTITVKKMGDTFIASEGEDEAMENQLDDYKNDPDWAKTPLGKWLNKMRSDKYRGTKRSSEGGCGCSKTNCTRRCSCRKSSNVCSESCKCSSDLCSNRGSDGDLNSVGDSEYVEGDTPNKKQRI